MNHEKAISHKKTILAWGIMGISINNYEGKNVFIKIRIRTYIIYRVVWYKKKPGTLVLLITI